MLGPAVESHRAHVLGASLLPGVAETQPVIGLLDLHTATGIKEAELVGCSPGEASIRRRKMAPAGDDNGRARWCGVI